MEGTVVMQSRCWTLLVAGHTQTPQAVALQDAMADAARQGSKGGWCCLAQHSIGPGDAAHLVHLGFQISSRRAPRFCKKLGNFRMCVRLPSPGSAKSNQSFRP